MIVAGFASSEALCAAVAELGAHRGVQTYSPSKLSDAGADAAVSPIPLIMFAAGLCGCGFMFWLQVYADVSGYVINVGGRPDNSWPAYVTNAFELGVLSAMLAGFVSFLIANRLPRLYDPVDECESLRAASRDGWFLSVNAVGEGAGREIRDILIRHRALTIEEQEA